MPSHIVAAIVPHADGKAFELIPIVRVDDEASGKTIAAAVATTIAKSLQYCLEHVGRKDVDFDADITVFVQEETLFAAECKTRGIDMSRQAALAKVH